MRPWSVVCMLIATGCAVESGSFADLTQPEVDAVRPSASTQPDGAAEDSFDLDGYVDEQREVDAADVSGVDALVAELGAEGVEVPPDSLGSMDPGLNDGGYEGEPLPLDAPLAMPQMMMPEQAPGTPAWTPDNAVTLSWGLRLVSTLDNTSPPRAILGMPNGSETVVRAGDLLADEGIIVLAVGSGVVQLGKVTAQGDHASVESVFLQAMYDDRPTGQ
ncbi:MAG: hypothetical protein AB8H79_00585 [Myxococcota bacterium]